MDGLPGSSTRTRDAISESGESDTSWQSVSSIDNASDQSISSAATWQTTGDLDLMGEMTRHLMDGPTTSSTPASRFGSPRRSSEESSDASASLMESVSVTEPSEWSDVGSASPATASIDEAHSASSMHSTRPQALATTARSTVEEIPMEYRESVWPRRPEGNIPARDVKLESPLDDTESQAENASTFSGFQSMTDTAPFHAHLDSRSLTPTPSAPSSNFKAALEPLVLEQIIHIDTLCAQSDQFELSRFATELVLECNRLRQQANASLSAWEIMNSRIGAAEVEGWATFLIVNADDPINVASIGQRMLDEVEQVRRTSGEIKEHHRGKQIQPPLRLGVQKSASNSSKTKENSI